MSNSMFDFDSHFVVRRVRSVFLGMDKLSFMKKVDPNGYAANG
jgi:hypothetical protein